MRLTSRATCDASHCSLSPGEASSGRALNMLSQRCEAARCAQGMLWMAAGVCSAVTGLSKAPSGGAAVGDGSSAAGGSSALGEPLFETGDRAAACKHIKISRTLQQPQSCRLHMVR